MNRREFALRGAGMGLLAALADGAAAAEPVNTLPGVWKFTFGEPEKITPVSTRHYQPSRQGLERLPAVSECPVEPARVRSTTSDRGCLVSLPLAPDEMVYGLGLQLHSFMQRGLKKKLRVNADPQMDSGDSHAPVPFYVTTRGYGVLIDTARYATFYCGNKVRKGERRGLRTEASGTATENKLPAAYARFRTDESSEVLIEIPRARGVDVYVFGGPDMLRAIARYNLFSGGGALPPRWGLGFWYRCFGQFRQDEVTKLAAELREREIPCDVLGLEPGWQSHAYSCSFVWSDKFPDPSGMLRTLGKQGYRVNLWEHAFTHPTSPLYEPLKPRSGDYEVWDGLVPDFLDASARKTFSDYHEREHVALGVAGYKLDECDNSDFTRNWSFPEFGRFPSGADGEQMHSLFGLRYQDTIQSAFERRGVRTYGLVRSSQALAAPYPYVLYSDLYNHREFIRGLVNTGFSGLLWCPEVRDARNTDDLVRRLETTVFSPLAMVNAWYIRNPPWQQVETAKNNAGQFAEDREKVEAVCRELIRLRMQLIPYLYSAFVRYHLEGIPPFRALVVDYPDDSRTWTVDNQYLCGESLLVAPMVAGEKDRAVYLPKGDWFDFWSGQKHAGTQTIRVASPVGQIPVFVQSGTLLALAVPTLHTDAPDSFRLKVRRFGEGAASAVLYEDDSGPSPAFTRVRLRWDGATPNGTIERDGTAGKYAYRVESWTKS